nr:DUF262 domain-containing protein [Candidatus Sigynarchaeota archaeon]
MINLPETQALPFQVLVDDIERGNLKIPQFQRDFVWDIDKSARLMDSILKGYPIGTFILWSTHDRLRAIRNIGDANLPDPRPDAVISYVLDGQQRLTTLYACYKGLKIERDYKISDYSNLYINLKADEDEQIINSDAPQEDDWSFIKINDLLNADLRTLATYPEVYHAKIDTYKERIKGYHFSIINVKNASIDVATDIFTRINTGGTILNLFQIMVAKTFDQEQCFDLAEKYDQLMEDLDRTGYDNLSESTILQAVAVVLDQDCTRKNILTMDKQRFIDAWDDVVDAVKRAIDYFKGEFRIPVDRLLPYDALLVPFAYFFHEHPNPPAGDQQRNLADFFWRVALSERYTSSTESKINKDVKKIDDILAGHRPVYEWRVDISEDNLKKQGYFQTGRSFVKAILCLYASFQPRSFRNDTLVNIRGDWLQRSNSKNYHHFFPKKVLRDRGYDDKAANHVLNITLVDDFLNKRMIRTKLPSEYMNEFSQSNNHLAETMKSHLINDMSRFGITDNDYDRFFSARAAAVKKELESRIINPDVV